MDDRMPWNMDWSCPVQNSFNLPPSVDYDGNNVQWGDSSNFNSYNPHWNDYTPPPFSYHYESYNQPLVPYDFSPLEPCDDPFGYEPNEPFSHVERHSSFEDAMFKHMEKMEEIAKESKELTERMREMDRIPINHEFLNLSQSAPSVFSFDDLEVVGEMKDEFEFEKSYIENEPKKGDSNFFSSSYVLPTLEPQPIKEEQLVSFHENERNPQNVFNLYDGLDVEDIVIFKAISSLVECCFIVEAYFENVGDMEPSTPHESPKCEMSICGRRESEEDGLEIFTNHDNKELVDVLKSENMEDEWYEVEFEFENTTFECKFISDLFIFAYMRFFTLVEISFLWYRDGYSDCLYIFYGVLKRRNKVKLGT